MRRETLPAQNQADGIGVETSVDSSRIERAVQEILLAIGEDPGREGIA